MNTIIREFHSVGELINNLRKLCDVAGVLSSGEATAFTIKVGGSTQLIEEEHGDGSATYRLLIHADGSLDPLLDLPGEDV